MERHESDGLVLDLDRFALHDGPGIRMSVFLKGCSMRCAWCHSPESQRAYPELLYQKAKCRGCMRCTKVCPNGVISPAQDEPTIEIDRTRCKRCFRCSDACAARALRVGGQWMTPDDVIDIAVRDRPFYDASRGGVTVSGGEPLMQPHFTYEVLRRLHELEIHTALETSGLGDAQDLLAIARHVDLLLYDIKLPDVNRHQQYTGVSNERIQHNLERLCEDEAIRKRIFVRTPLIPGVNDAASDIDNIIRRVKSLGIESMDVLPYNRMADAKYEWIGEPYPMGVLPEDAHVDDEGLRERIMQAGLRTEFEREG